MARRSRTHSGLAESLSGSLWVLPAVSVLGALLLGTVLAEYRSPMPPSLDTVLFSGDADAARALLSVVAGSIITVTSLVFSLTVLTLQIASSQYSPRLLRNFLQDRGNQVVLSTFLATFAYCLAVLRTMSDGQVPTLAVSGVLAFVLASLAMLVYVIHHIAHSIRLDTILRAVERKTLDAIDRNHPEVVAGAEWATDLPEVPHNAAVVPARSSGYLQTLRGERLVPVAGRHNVIVRFVPMVGDQVVYGAPLAWVWHPGTQSERPDVAALVKPVNAAVHLGYERTLQQDVAFGIRQFVDVAVKGVSAAVNDPTTTVEAVGHLSVVLARLAGRRLGSQLLGPDGATVRVAVPRRDFAGYMDLACHQIRRFGASEPSVAEALLGLLRGVAENTASEDRRATIRAHRDLVVAAAERHNDEPADLAPVRAAAAALTASLARGSSRSGGASTADPLSPVPAE